MDFVILCLLLHELGNNPAILGLCFPTEKVGMREHGVPPRADVDPLIQEDRRTWSGPRNTSYWKSVGSACLRLVRGTDQRYRFGCWHREMLLMVVPLCDSSPCEKQRDQPMTGKKEPPEARATSSLPSQDQTFAQ